MPAIEYVHTPTSNMAWDAGAVRKDLKEGESAEYYRKEFAWEDPAMDPKSPNKGDFKFPHHECSSDGTIGAANLKACSSAIGVLNGGRGGSQIPAEDHAAVHAHLAHHLKDAGQTPPELKADNKPTNKRTVSITDIKFRAAADGKPATVSGHAAVFNQLSQPLWELGGGCEMIASGAFGRTISKPDDIRLLINHDANLVLARNVSGTLKLSEDNIGLAFEAELGDQSYAKDLAISMARGDITGCSFAFMIDDSENIMQAGSPVQLIKAATVSDVSIVTYPAYLGASASIRANENELRFEKSVYINSTENTPGVPDANKDSADLWRVKAASRKRELDLLSIQ